VKGIGENDKIVAAISKNGPDSSVRVAALSDTGA